jgi:hypothetical protein
MLRSIAEGIGGSGAPGVVRDPVLNDFTHLVAAEGIVT